MSESNNVGEKTLTLNPTKTLSLKRPVEQGTVSVFSPTLFGSLISRSSRGRCHAQMDGGRASRPPSAQPSMIVSCVPPGASPR